MSNDIKEERGKSRLTEVIWHGKSDAAKIEGLRPNTEYSLALIGYVKNGVTNTEEFTVRTRLAAPEIDPERFKVGETTVILAWKLVNQTEGTVMKYIVNTNFLKIRVFESFDKGFHDFTTFARLPS